MSKLKAFVRFDGSGNIVPSSIILAKSKPKVGDWKETQAYECCDITTTTTTTLDPLCKIFRIDGFGNGTWTGIDCDGNPYSTGISFPGEWQIFPCYRTIATCTEPFEELGICGASCKTWLVSETIYPSTISYYDCGAVSNSIIINEPTEICALYIVAGSKTTIVETGIC